MLGFQKKIVPKESSESKTVFEFSFSGLQTLFLILFVGLKLGGVIEWSWLWVSSPIWLPYTLIFASWGILWVTAHLLIKHSRKYTPFI